jgi:hypothetical protein
MTRRPFATHGSASAIALTVALSTGCLPSEEEELPLGGTAATVDVGPGPTGGQNTGGQVGQGGAGPTGGQHIGGQGGHGGNGPTGGQQTGGQGGQGGTGPTGGQQAGGQGGHGGTGATGGQTTGGQATGGESPPPPPPPDDSRSETGDRLCGNGLDDDGDGFIDCDDYHCLYNPAVTVCPTVTENTDALCTNGMDDDGNGFADCRDYSCSRNPWVGACGVTETTDERCSNGLDDDGNGFTDCADNSCGRNALVSVCARQEAGFCLDRVDNDGDGMIDCGDPDCAVAAPCGGQPPPPPVGCNPPCAAGLACRMATGDCGTLCDRDSDCGRGFFCDDICVEGCRQHANCPLETYCDGGQCVAGCATDRGCHPGSICENATCVPGCREHRTCPADTYCAAGFQTCRPIAELGRCRTDAACGFGEICDLRTLTCQFAPGLAPCAQTCGGCGPGTACVRGQCVQRVPGQGCSPDVECAVDMICSPATMTCVSQRCVGGLCDAGLACERGFACFSENGVEAQVQACFGLEGRACGHALDCAGLPCVDGLCRVDGACGGDIDCASGRACISGRCLPYYEVRCTDAGDCAPGLTCDPDIGYCRPL